MGQYDAIRAKAIALIKKKGRDCFLLVSTNATPADAAKPWRVGTGSITSVPFRGVVTDVPMSNRGEGAKGEQAKNCMVPGDIATVPDCNMRVQVGNDVENVYAIAAFNIYDPDGIPIGYKLRLETWPIQSPTS